MKPEDVKELIAKASSKQARLHETLFFFFFFCLNGLLTSATGETGDL
jgi:hypothetical protein